MYYARERQWRAQHNKSLALRRWINRTIGLWCGCLIREIEGVREAVKKLQGVFPADEERYLAAEALDEITQKAGPDMNASEWFTQWCLAYTKARRLKVTGTANDDFRLTLLQFLKAARQYK